MKRGPKPTTRRSPGQGGRECRTWLSAEEYEALLRAAGQQGLSPSAWARGVMLDALSMILLHDVQQKLQSAQDSDTI